MLPTIRSYGDYSSSNYGVNSLRVDFNTISLFYSYDTIIAFIDDNGNRKVIKNYWSTTTGKHLNWIDDGDKKSRLDKEEFGLALQELLTKHNL